MAAPGNDLETREAISTIRAAFQKMLRDGTAESFLGVPLSNIFVSRAKFG